MGSLSYLVVEEIVEEVTAITISAWPAADGRGRLRFEGTEPAEVAVTTEMLQAELYDGWLNRERRIGDVFAAVVNQDVLDEATESVWRGPLKRLLPGPVYDLTAEARTVAKLALYAARSDILTEGEAAANAMDEKEVRNDEPANHRAELDGRGDAT
ncbi:MAG: hypothetical protein GEU74_12115 [Nitriliruptorales bacterium]|nr:hypothetical protein [Nitriliruptorales bacterium]